VKLDLSVSSEDNLVSSLPVSSSGGSIFIVVSSLSLETSVFLTGGSKTSEFSVLLDGLADPVDLGVSSNGLVGGVDKDDFEEFEGGVLTNPVRVEDSEVADSSADSLFSDGSEGSSELQTGDTLMLGLSADDTLGDGSLSASSSDSNSVDHVSLLPLEAQLSGLLGSGGSGASVHDGKLSVLPGSHSQDESHQVRVLLFPKLFEIFVSSHRYTMKLINFF